MPIAARFIASQKRADYSWCSGRSSVSGITSCLLTALGVWQVRMVDARPGIAFVEMENDMQASVAMQGLQNFKITPTHAMNITFAKQ